MVNLERKCNFLRNLYYHHHHHHKKIENLQVKKLYKQL